jgi:hypothetical protein
MSAEKPLVYLDQNVLSVMARYPGGWRASPYGQVLTMEHPEAECWISPSHVVELLLHPDRAERTATANMMLEMTDVRRMAPDYASEVIEGFIGYMQKACPNVLISRTYVDEARDSTCEMFLAALALMATGRDPKSEIVESVTRSKIEGRWLRAEAGADPDEWMKKVEAAAKSLALVHGDPRPELSNKPLDDLVAEIRVFEDHAERGDWERLRKLAPTIVRAYAVGDVFEALGVIFKKFPVDVVFTFNFEEFAKCWQADFQWKRKCPALPGGMQLFDRGTWMLTETAKSLWHPANGGVVAADVAQGVIIGHYLERLNERGRERKGRLKHERATNKLPTDSLTFDADHASLALRRADVFVTQDLNLAEVSQKSRRGSSHRSAGAVRSSGTRTRCARL